MIAASSPASAPNPRHVFDARSFVAGHLALDFANTVTARDSEPRDFLEEPAGLGDWAKASGHFAPKELAGFIARLKEHPAKAEKALRRARRVREAICGVFAALARGRKPAMDDLQHLDVAWHAAAAAAGLQLGRSAAELRWSVERSGLDLLAHVTPWEAVELLRGPHCSKVRVCDGAHCGWLFLDTSKSGRRRWCDMATCGNVAKARRHQARQKEAG